MNGPYPSAHSRHKDAKPPVVIYLHRGEDGAWYAHYVCQSCRGRCGPCGRWCARVDMGTREAA